MAKKHKLDIVADQHIKNVSISKHVERAMYSYGEEVLKNRAIPDYRDGLKPVHRKIIYYMHATNCHSLTKSAEISGTVTGKLSPHSDDSTQAALVSLCQTKSHFPMVHGHGNWGSYFENAGAKRYIDCRLHNNAKFLTEYMPLAEMTQTYTGKWVEPVYLPSTIPNLLIQGAQGIAVGATTSIPAHDPVKVFETVIAYYKGQRTLKKLVSILESPVYLYGGNLKSDKLDLNNMYKEGRGSLYFFVDYQETVQDKNKALRITGVPPGFITGANSKFKKDNFVSFLDKLKKVPCVSRINDDSGREYDFDIYIILKRDSSYADALKELDKLFTRSISYNWNIVITDKTEEGTKFKKVNLLSFLEMWCQYREELEQKWLDYQLALLEKELWKINLLLLVYKNLDKVFKILKSDKSKELLMKQLKLDELQADYVLGLSLNSLTKKNIARFKDRLLAIKIEQKDLRSKKKNIIEHLITLFKGYIKIVKASAEKTVKPKNKKLLDKLKEK